jgi:Holliday junction resolvase RusA-like endonuclease
MFERDAVDVFRQIDVVIEGRPPTLNARRHWRSIARDNATWKVAAANAAADAAGEWEAHHAGIHWRKLSKVALSVTFIVPTKARRDFDNLISTLKPLLDGIVAVGLIDDDSTDVIAHLDFGVRYEKGRAATLLQIAEIEDA